MRRGSTLVLLIGLALVAAPVLAGGADCQKHAAKTAAHTTKPCEMSAEDCDKWMAEAKTRPWLGVDLDGDGTGAWTVTRVVPESPAERAGIREGDQLVAMNGVAFGEANKDKLAAVKKSLKPGDSVTYGIRRDGVDRDVTATLTRMPEAVYVAMVEEHKKAHTEVASR
jgi:C-terminal processing protease CtpA/Prc